MTESKTALIVGGAGFLGTNLALELKKRGYTVKVLDYDTHGRIPLFEKEGIEYSDRDVVSDGEFGVYTAAKECSVVFYLATVCLPHSFKEPEWTLRVSTEGALNSFMAASRHNAFFVYCSSSEIYGNGPVPMAETQLPHPSTIYGAAKAAGELVTEAYARLKGETNQYLIVRPFNCYGPYAREDLYATVVTNFIRKMLTGGEAVIRGDGKQTRDFNHVQDIVDGLITAYEKREKLALYPVINLCTGRETSLNELWELCQDAVVDVWPNGMERLMGPQPHVKLVYDEQPRKGDVKRMCGFTRNTKMLIGWKSKITLEQGLREYTKWMLKNGRV